MRLRPSIDVPPLFVQFPFSVCVVYRRFGPIRWVSAASCVTVTLSSFSSPLSVVLHCTHRFSFVRRVCFLSFFYPLLSVLMFFMKLIEKNEERFELAEKAENPMSTRENCEHWLGNATSWQNTYKIGEKIDEFLVSAKGYNYSFQEFRKDRHQ